MSPLKKNICDIWIFFKGPSFLRNLLRKTPFDISQSHWQILWGCSLSCSDSPIQGVGHPTKISELCCDCHCYGQGVRFKTKCFQLAKQAWCSL